MAAVPTAPRSDAKPGVQLSPSRAFPFASCPVFVCSCTGRSGVVLPAKAPAHNTEAHLLHDLRSAEVAQQPLPPRVAELAVHSAADLGVDVSKEEGSNARREAYLSHTSSTPRGPCSRVGSSWRGQPGGGRATAVCRQPRICIHARSQPTALPSCVAAPALHGTPSPAERWPDPRGNNLPPMAPTLHWPVCRSNGPARLCTGDPWCRPVQAPDPHALLVRRP